MLDESMFEDIHEIAENSAYLKAVEEKDVSLEMYEQLPPYEQCGELESRLAADGLLTFESVFGCATGYYCFSCFLTADYSADKATFLKDVEAYRGMRFESARKKIAVLLYQRFVSLEEEADNELIAANSATATGGGDTNRAKQQQQMQQQLDSVDGAVGLSSGASSSSAASIPSGGNLGAAGNRNTSVFARFNARGLHPASVMPAPSHTSHSLSASVAPAPPPPPPSHLLLRPTASNNNNTSTHTATPSNGPPSAVLHVLPRGTHSVAVHHSAAVTLSSSSSPSSAAPNAAALRVPSSTRQSRSQPSTSHSLDDTDAAQPATAQHSDGSSAARSMGSSVGSASSSSVLPSLSSAASTPLSANNATASSFPASQSALQSSSSVGTPLCVGRRNNVIGVYGKSVAVVRARVLAGDAPKELFDDVARQVRWDLKLDAFPRFKHSVFYQRYIRTKAIEGQKVAVKDFTTFRVLGRGGFGAVHACRKKNSGTIYAMKAINKKLVKVKAALDNVLEERNVLTRTTSPFVTNLKYALQDDESLYLVMDLMLGGDLKFHLISAQRFTEKRARFYAAQVLLGLEHIHRMSIIYRDMKLENVLLDERGHCKISDLGLAVVTKVKIKGYAGTPGYTAPEMIRNKLYGASCDIFSYGVMLYRMLCGAKPFKGKVDRELDKAVLERKVSFAKELFSSEAVSLLTGLLNKKPHERLGCGERGIAEIKEQPFFESIDWGLLEAGYIDPPFVPNKFDVNAASLKDIGDFDRTKYKAVKLDERFKQRTKQFEWVNVQALQDEMVAVMEKADHNCNFEKFAHTQHKQLQTTTRSNDACCVVI